MHCNGFRKDINGLRAVAVLLVAGYHFFPNLVPFGFLGVDIFFVISGYLMTSIIINDIYENKFNYWSFMFHRDEKCYGSKELVPLYFDHNHMSENGNILLLNLFGDVLK